MPAVHLTEWQTLSPEEVSAHGGDVVLDSHSRSVAKALYDKNFVLIEELRTGIALKTTSYVGRVNVGELQLHIRPKIDSLPLLELFHYGYELRNVHLFSKHALEHAPDAIQDILILQLVEEVKALFRRGVHQEYVTERQDRAALRGKPDLERWFRRASEVSAVMPCILTPRSADNSLNQLLLAGLRLAHRIAVNRDLRFRCSHLAEALAESTSAMHLSRSLFQAARSRTNRLTRHYAGALSLVRILAESSGVALDGESSAQTVPGFLFDMNQLFQSVLARLLSENLAEHEVIPEQSLSDMIRYADGYNPRHRTAPLLRPDIIIRKDKKTVAVLDAKYRDLWQHKLPRHMLYQLGMYALAAPEQTATILYPTPSQAATEQRLVICNPELHSLLGNVILRPVRLAELVELLRNGQNNSNGRKTLQAFASQLAFGQT